MKLLQLNLLRFGPFSQHRLDLHEGEQGLHVVLGLNEAGKTSALRALRQALYGIEHHTPDGFRHAFPDLRVGATVRTHNGRSIEFIRRKSQKKPLRGADDETILDPAELANCLDGVENSEMFSRRFGIDHRDLGEGSALLDQSRGSLRELLFATGAGITGLARIINELQKEAGELFVSGAKKPRLNKACTDYVDATNRLKKARLPTAAGALLEKELDDARRQCAQLEPALNDLRAERERLTRFEQAIRLIANRTQLQEELRAVADAVILPEDFGKQRLEAMTSSRHAESRQTAAQQELDAIERSVCEIALPVAVLDSSAVIDAMYQRLGSYRTAQNDRPSLVSRRQLREADAQRMLRQILQRDADPIEADPLHLSPDQKVRLQELAASQGAIAARYDSAKRQQAALQARRDQLASELEALAPPRDASELEDAVRRCRQAGDLEQRWRETQQQLQGAREQGAIELSRLTLWSGGLETLEKLPVPQTTIVDQFEHEFQSMELERKQVRQRQTDAQAEFADFDCQLAELDLQHDVPSEADLARARQRRDAGWQLVVQVWQTGHPDEAERGSFLGSEPLEKLAEEFRLALEQADRIADRLRHEAERVSKKAGLVAGIARNKVQQSVLEARLADVKNDRLQLVERWSAAWAPAGVQPLSPREMRVWIDKQSRLSSVAQNVRGLQSQSDELLHRICQHTRELRVCVERLGDSCRDCESIAALLDLAERTIARVNQEIAERKALADEAKRIQGELPAAEAAFHQAQNDYATLQSEWAQETERLRLSPRATAAQVLALLTALDELHDKRQQADGLQERIDGIDRDAQQFSAEARQLAERVAPDLAEQSVEAIIETLHTRLNQARQNRTRLEELDRRRGRESSKLEIAQADVRQARAALTALCELAGCSEAMDLAEAEERSKKRRDCERELRGLTEHLLILAAGSSLEDFLLEAQAIDPAQLRPRQETLGHEIEAAQRHQTELNQTIGALNNRLLELGGASPCEDVELERSDLIARIQGDAERFARLRLASAVLKRAMERYREKNEGPVMARAGEIFRQLTLDSFIRLQSDFDDSGNPVVRGVRADGKTVGVREMSEGARNQLYLALRLASLHHHLDCNPPFPFIVDDILIQFDDERAAAALEALAELSARTQVIFFTHHEHLVELASSRLPGEVVFTHLLDCRTSYSPPLAATALAAAGRA